MSAQAEPEASHLRQMYESLIGFPVQLPGSAVCDCPTSADPEIVGEERFTGTPAGGAAAAVSCGNGEQS
jgi:hypothetical protein